MPLKRLGPYYCAPGGGSARPRPRPPPASRQAAPPRAAGRTRSGGLKFARSGGAAARRAIGPRRLICIDARAGRRSAPAGAFIGSAAVKRRGSAGGAAAGRGGAAEGAAAAAAAAAEEHQ